MAAIASGPMAMADRYAAVATMSVTPIANSAGSKRRGTRQAGRRTSTNAAIDSTDATRTVTTGATSRLSSMPFVTIGNTPKSAPVATAIQKPLGRPSDSAAEDRETSTTLATAQTIPMTASHDGMPSVAKPYSTGSVAVITAATGATTPIRPTLSA